MALAMRVLVTGSTGYVGRTVAARLCADGHTVIGLSRRDVSAATSDHVAIDIGDPEVVERLSRAVQPCNAIVHAAAALDTASNARSVAFVNCWGSQALLSIARSWAVDRFIYISSIGVIGTPVHLPIKEDHPTDPLYVYHASKLFGEYLVNIAASDGVRGVSLRITSPIGPAMPEGRILSVFVERALRGQELVLLGRGTRCQNYVDVRDIADAVARCLDRGPSGVLNVAGARTISNCELAATCVESLGSSSEIRFEGEDPAEGLIWDVSYERAQAAIGYSPRYAIADSIRSIAADR
jgi:UDP-glucose 4-epimerase